MWPKSLGYVFFCHYLSIYEINVLKKIEYHHFKWIKGKFVCGIWCVQVCVCVIQVWWILITFEIYIIDNADMHY